MRGSDFLVDGVTILMDTADAQQLDGLRMAASTRGVFTRCNMQDARWVGLGISDRPADTSKDCQIIESVAEGCYVGIYSNGRATKVDRCYASNHWSTTTEFTAKGGVWSAPSLYYDGVIMGGTGWSVTNCRLEDNAHSGIYFGGGVGECVIAGTRSSATSTRASTSAQPASSRSPGNSLRRLVVTGNVLRDNATGDIHFRHADKSVVANNVCIRTQGRRHVAVEHPQRRIPRQPDRGDTVTIANATAAGIFLNDGDGAIGNALL